MDTPKTTSRRAFLRLTALGAAGTALLAACGPAATPTAAPAAAKPGPEGTPAPKPAAAAPTATTAPGAPATKPAEPTKPAAAAATKPAAAPATAKGAPVTLRVWAWSKGEVDDAIKLFEQENPSVKLNYEIFSPQSSFEDKLETSFAGGNPPDVFRQNDDSIPYYARRQVVLPLEDRLGSAIKRDEVYWDAIEKCTVGGHLQAVPIGIRTGAVYINVDMFNQAGVPLPPRKYPDEAWSWDKFVEAAQKLAKGTEVYGFSTAHNQDWLLDNVKTNGGRIMDEKCMKFMLSEEPAVQALQYWADTIVDKKVSAPVPTIEALGGDTQMFGAGKSAMVSSSAVPLQGKLNFKWDVVGRPVVPGKPPVTFLAIQTWAAAKATKAPDEAVKLLAFFVGEAAQKTFVGTGAVIPINKRIAENDYVKRFPEANMKIHLDAVPYGQTMPLAVGMKDVKDLFNAERQQIVLGQKKAKEAMQSIEAKANAALQKANGCV